MPFEKGNQIRKGKASPNSGRKTDKTLSELQRVMEEACPYQDRVEAFRVLTGSAKAGDVNAAKLMFGYLYGTPLQRTEIAGADGRPIEIVSVEAVKPENARPDRDNE
jgi:hypothetical protein